jgi:phage-related protein
VSPFDRPLVWLHGEIKTPPFSHAARLEAGSLLRRLQKGNALGMPHSRPMPSVGPGCHELRIHAPEADWRIVYRPDPDAVVILTIFSKKSRRTPDDVIAVCRRRLKEYDGA